MIDRAHPLLLASSSPRRSALLQQLGLPFASMTPDVDERPLPNEQPSTYVVRMSESKLDKARASLPPGAPPYAGILTADTVVVQGGRVFSKPGDNEEAAAMLSALCGASHEVITAYCLLHRLSGERRARSVTTQVRFRAASSEEIAGYVATGEGRDKAGAYAIQGLGALFVESIHGSYSNVVGLPVCELVLDLKEMALLGQYP